MKYYAFISYSRKDEEWGKWIQHEFEHYKLPVTLNGKEGLPSEFRPIFRDVDELVGGNLPKQIYDALSNSEYLIVICSPSAVKSKWVGKEIMDFIEIGRSKGKDNIENIFPFIVDGVPYSKDSDAECFPEPLRHLPDNKERIGGNIYEGGRDLAFIKVLVGTLKNVSLGEVWNRYEEEKIAEERRKREEQNKLWLFQSRFLAQKMNDLVDKGDSYLACMLGLIALPAKLDDPNERPYCPEVEGALRNALRHESFRFNKSINLVKSHIVLSSDGQYIATFSSNKIYVLQIKDGAIINEISNNLTHVYQLLFSEDNRYILCSSSEGIHMWGLQSNIQILGIKHGGSPFALTNDNKILVYTYENNKLAAYQRDYNTAQLFCGGHRNVIVSISLSGDNLFILTASEDRLVKLWELKSGRCLKTFKGHSGQVVKAIFAPDKKTAVSVSKSSELIIWDLASGAMKQCRILQDNNIIDVNFSSNGKQLVITTHNSQRTIYDSETIEILDYDVAPCNISYTTSDYKLQLCNEGTSGFGVRFSKLPYKIVAKCKFSGILKFATYSTDGESVLSLCEGKQICVWNKSLNSYTYIDIGGVYSARLAEYSEDGNVLVLVTTDNKIVARDLKNEKTLLSVYEDEKVTSISISPNSDELLLGLTNGNIHIWNLQTGSMTNVRYEQNSYNYCYHVQYSINEDNIAFSDHLGLSLLNLQTGTVNRLLQDNESIHTIKYSLNGLYLAATTNRVFFLWNLSNDFPTIQYTFSIETDVQSIDFSTDSRYLLYSKGSHSFVVCDVQTGAIVLEQEIYWNNDITNTIKKVQFSRSGTEILVALRYGDIYIFEFIPLQDIIDQLKVRFKDRELTLKEKKEFYLE